MKVMVVKTNNVKQLAQSKAIRKCRNYRPQLMLRSLRKISEERGIVSGEQNARVLPTAMP